MKARLSLQAQALQARHGAALMSARQQLAEGRARQAAAGLPERAAAPAPTATPAAAAARYGFSPRDLTVVPRPQPLVLAWRVLLTAGPVLVLLWVGRAQLLALWQALLTAWVAALQLPLQWQAVTGGLRLAGSALDDGTTLPSLWGLGGTALAGLLLWLASARLPDAWLPLRVLLRALLLVQAVALLFVVLRPAQFPYTLGSHLSTLLNLGYGFLLAVPVLLALGWGVLALPLWQRLLVPLALVGWLALLLPHKALLQVWLLTHSSVLFMPVLFVALGPLFDLMVFVALYGWLLSLRPAGAALSPGDPALQADEAAGRTDRPGPLARVAPSPQERLA